MPTVAVVTIVGAALTVLALAGFLISVALILWRVDRRLRSITAGVGVITEKAAPAGPVVREINQDLAGVDNALRAVLSKRRLPKFRP